MKPPKFTVAGSRDTSGTKTVRSNREIRLHDNVVALLKWENPAPLSADPEEYIFTTPQGAPVDVTNFHKREWLPMLRRLQIRPRPFYNTRHSYVSFLYSIGARIRLHLQPNRGQHKNPRI